MIKNRNPKNIKIITIDPYHLEKNGKLHNLMEMKLLDGDIDNLNTSNEILSYLLDNQLFKNIEGIFIKVIPPYDGYSLTSHAPYDDIIIGYSLKENFTIEEGGKIFNLLDTLVDKENNLPPEKIEKYINGQLPEDIEIEQQIEQYQLD